MGSNRRTQKTNASVPRQQWPDWSLFVSDSVAIRKRLHDNQARASNLLEEILRRRLCQYPTRSLSSTFTCPFCNAVVTSSIASVKIDHRHICGKVPRRERSPASNNALCPRVPNVQNLYPNHQRIWENSQQAQKPKRPHVPPSTLAI